MKKMMVLLKRKSGMTTDAFQNHYENKHAALGARFFEGLLLDFRRYYPEQMVAFPAAWRQLESMPIDQSGYDAISVYTFKDEAALEEYFKRMKDPEIGRILIEDEVQFLDRVNCRVGFCDALEGQGITST